jgi:DNA (cytosine-5)-methyltransferase 1
MNSVGLFAGIGGIELGFKRAGIGCELLCELDDAAGAVLGRAFPSVELHKDVTDLYAIPEAEIVAGGFPCQNLSLAGDNSGIHGSKSGLVGELFRLIKGRSKPPTWLVLENVPFMLWQKKGEAMRFLIGELERLGYRWAYRVIDSRAFGLPQRRRRVIFLASQSEDPRDVLFADDISVRYDVDDGKSPCGFFWTEGRAGLGWAVNAVPTLKAGSSVGIPSLPAIWFRDSGHIATPNICDAERLQGFRANWTRVAVGGKPVRDGVRCRLVGNAVNVRLAVWLGKRLLQPGQYDSSRTLPEFTKGVWPNAAYGERGRVYPVEIGEFPRKQKYQPLEPFLKHPTKPLSERAARGFLKRAREGRLNFAQGFLEAVEKHIEGSV